MLDGYERYAVYAAPDRATPLGAFGASWLGWDAEAGVELRRPAIDALPEPIEALTVSASRYGFHGTLKAPFRLAEGRTPEGLAAAVAALAAELRPIDAPLRLADLHGFIALRPAEPSPDLAAIAFACVSRLDAFRAPPSEADLARRRASGLSPRQDAHLARWGYPYVDDEFHFHLTLTKRLEPDPGAAAIAALSPHLAEALAAPWRFDSLCLFGDPGGGAHFRLLSRFPMGG